MKEHILFVDDDSGLLDGLRRMLRPLRNEWEMFFCSSGKEALDRLESTKCDVIVSDMRMPEMDGAELLNFVMTRCPHTVRIILSGQAELDAVIRSLKPAHQYIEKPCDATKLKQIIQTTCRPRRTLKNESLVAFVSQRASLPSDPAILQGFVAATESPKLDFAQLGSYVRSDVGLGAKFLQFISTGFFGTRNPSFDLSSAPHALGTELLLRIVRDTALFDWENSNGSNLEERRTINAHSLAVAEISREIAMMECEETLFANACFSAGLLHDIGKLVLFEFDPDSYPELYRRRFNTENSLEVEEQNSYGTTHADVGAYLLSLWGIPTILTDAVAGHHQPAKFNEPEFGVTSVIHVANALQDCYEQCQNRSEMKDLFPRLLDSKYMASVKMRSTVDDWLEVFLTRVRNLE